MRTPPNPGQSQRRHREGASRLWPKVEKLYRGYDQYQRRKSRL
jgi:hypothetical protein